MEFLFCRDRMGSNEAMKRSSVTGPKTNRKAKMKHRLGRKHLNPQTPSLEPEERPSTVYFSKLEMSHLVKEFHDLHHGIYSKAQWDSFMDEKRSEREVERMEA
jgi:hypothetical protein